MVGEGEGFVLGDRLLLFYDLLQEGVELDGFSAHGDEAAFLSGEKEQVVDESAESAGEAFDDFELATLKLFVGVGEGDLDVCLDDGDGVA